MGYKLQYDIRCIEKRHLYFFQKLILSILRVEEGVGRKQQFWVLPKNPNLLGFGFFTAKFIEKK